MVLHATLNTLCSHRYFPVYGLSTAALYEISKVNLHPKSFAFNSLYNRILGIKCLVL